MINSAKHVRSTELRNEKGDVIFADKIKTIMTHVF